MAARGRTPDRSSALMSSMADPSAVRTPAMMCPVCGSRCHLSCRAHIRRACQPLLQIDQIYGLLKQGDTFKQADYQFSWRRNGDLTWIDIDPRLEIEQDHLTLLQKLVNRLSGSGKGRVR
jgi:hypothetical protein